MPILELEDVTKSFGALKVADAISFAVEDGEALGIIGPNGAGKSTLFNLVTGNLALDGGGIRFLGRDVTRMPPMRRCTAGLGRTFQIPQPFGKLTVFENLLVAATFGSRRSETAAAGRCADILVETGLAERANVPAGRLTLLERKRHRGLLGRYVGGVRRRAGGARQRQEQGRLHRPRAHGHATVSFRKSTTRLASESSRIRWPPTKRYSSGSGSFGSFASRSGGTIDSGAPSG